MSKLDERINVPVSADLLERIDAYRARIRPIPARAETVRQLVEAALEGDRSAPATDADSGEDSTSRPLERDAGVDLSAAAAKLETRKAEAAEQRRRFIEGLERGDLHELSSDIQGLESLPSELKRAGFRTVGEAIEAIEARLKETAPPPASDDPYDF